jgi:hypothetical protein
VQLKLGNNFPYGVVKSDSTLISYPYSRMLFCSAFHSNSTPNTHHTTAHFPHSHVYVSFYSKEDSHIIYTGIRMPRFFMFYGLIWMSGELEYNISSTQFINQSAMEHLWSLKR